MYVFSLVLPVDSGSFVEYAEQMLLTMQMKDEISPTLSTIVSQFDEDNRRLREAISSMEETEVQEDMALPDDADFGADSLEIGSNWDFNHYDDGDVGDEDASFVDPAVPSNIEVLFFDITMALWNALPLSF